LLFWWESFLLFIWRQMTTTEKISIALPAEMVSVVRSAVATGEYASSNEVIRDALRALRDDWVTKGFP
jgi:antitoxin ParD1/3/4